jgi:hypothetical protein
MAADKGERMVRLVPLAALLLACPACKKEQRPLPQPRATKPAASEQPTAKPAASEQPTAKPAATEQPTAKPEAKAAKGPGAATEPAVPPLTHQPSHEMVKLGFLGWTRDGSRFVIRATHGRCMGALAGDDELELYQVHDALTGKLVDSYRISRTADRDVKRDSLWSLAAKEAKPRAQFKAFREQTPLVASKPRRTAPSGGLAITMRSAGKAPLGTTFSVQRSAAGARYEWSGFDPARKPADDRRVRSPRATVLLTAPGKPAVRLLALSVKDRYSSLIGWVEESNPVKAHGEVKAFWSPAGDRLVLVIASDVDGPNDEDPMDAARFYIRTAGPQYRLVAPAAAEGRARALARGLAAAGFPPTDLALTAKALEKTVIGYRDKDGEALARAIAAALPGEAELKLIKRPGWLRALVRLGRPALAP